MTPLVIGVALCSLLAVIVLVVVALPHLREGEDLLSDSGRERVREQAQRARGALADVSDAVRARASRPAAVAGGQDQPPTEAAAPLPAAVPVRPTPVPVRPAPVPVRPAPGPVSGDGGASARPVPAPVPVANVPARAAAPSGMTGSRSTTYRATGEGGVVSSRSAAWQELAESSDPAVRAAARVVDLRPAGEGEAAHSAAALPAAERSAGPAGQAPPEPPAPAGP